MTYIKINFDTISRTYLSLYRERIPIYFSLNLHGHNLEEEPAVNSGWCRKICVRRGRTNKIKKPKKRTKLCMTHTNES
jgi:hypothetical protein